MRGTDHKQAGFTLIEVIVVLAIAALVFSVGAFGLSALKGRTTPERSAGEIAELMNAVHQVARDAGERQSVTIALTGKRIFAPVGNRAVELPEDYAVSVTVGRETVSNEKSLEVHFLPDGTSSGAEIVITGPTKQHARVDINWLTGLARVADERP